jgi:hypothetical protein
MVEVVGVEVGVVGVEVGVVGVVISKYGWKEFEIWMNFPYRNFSRFEIEFELKFRECSLGRI